MEEISGARRNVVSGRRGWYIRKCKVQGAKCINGEAKWGSKMEDKKDGAWSGYTSKNEKEVGGESEVGARETERSLEEGEQDEDLEMGSDSAVVMMLGRIPY
ncbi:hypothetical protein ACMFMG_010105 [Clarireedia jacksonii]